MIELSIPVFLVLLEALFVVAALMVYWYVRARRAVRAAMARHQTRAAPKASAYLDHELQQTRVRIKAAGDSAVAAVLKLRADYLGLERECAERPNRDEDFWAALSERLSTLGKPARPATAAELVAARSVDTRALIESTAKEIESLKDHVAKVVADPEQGSSELLKQIDRVGRVNRELADCVAVLEDENDLLRNQVQAPRGSA